MKKERFQSDRVLAYFRLEWKVLVLITLSGLIYNLGLLAGPWFEGKMAGCLVDILNGNREQVEPGVDGMMCRLDAKEICDTVEALLKDEEKCRKLGKKAAEKSFLEDKDVLKPFDF